MVHTFFKLIKLLMARSCQRSSIVAVSSWGASHALPCYSLVGSYPGARLRRLHATSPSNWRRATLTAVSPSHDLS